MSNRPLLALCGLTLLAVAGCKSQTATIIDDNKIDVDHPTNGWGLRKLDPKDYPKGVRVLSPQTSRLMLDLMRRNVIEGTGKRADAPGLSVGGKTGTGEKPENGGIARHKVLSSFASVFPTQGPLDAKRYFVLISIDEPDPSLGPVTAVTTAAPVAGRVIDRIAPFLGVTRVPPPAGTAKPAAPVQPVAIDPSGEE